MSVDNLDSSLRAIDSYEGVPLLGTVTENIDPLNLSRIKVRIAGLYDPDKGEVPWAGPIKNSQFGISDSWGIYGSPAVGSDVVVYLQNGDPHYPVYYSIQRHANPEFASGTSWGFVDPKGNKLKVDLTSGSITLTTNDNVVFNTDGQGNLSVTVPGTTSVESTGNITVTGDADITVNAAANVNMTAGATMHLTAATLNIDAPTNVNGNVSTTGTLTNNGKNVGSTHKHSGVSTGSGQTGNPV